MNAKLCRKLRRMARQLAFDEMARTQVETPPRKLMVHPAHEKSFREGTRKVAHTTAVNHPQSVRGIYRWLKRNYAKAIA